MNAAVVLTVCRSWRRFVAAGLCVVLAGGCEALRPTASTPAPGYYSLDDARGNAAGGRALPAAAPTLVIGPPRAAAGFDSQRIIYVREAHRLEYFAHSEWIDPPARMLAPLIVAALRDSGGFSAVVLAPSSAGGDLRLDTEVLRLQQEFAGQPSRVRFTLRAALVENTSRRVIASRDFEGTALSASEGPYGGVLAANQAVRAVLEDLATFCATAAANWRPADGRNDDRRDPRGLGPEASRR
mgnify:CR=1 FL=1